MKKKFLKFRLMRLRTLNTDYNHLGTKIFTLLATELAVITFIFASNGSFVPKEIYGIIFFGIGVALVIISIAMLFWSVTANKWASPAELNVLRSMYHNTTIDFLHYLKDDYISAYEFCLGRYNKRRVVFDSSIIAFGIGAIILMIIKFGG